LRRPHRVGVLGAGLAAVALLASGCGTGGIAKGAQAPDLTNGQKLFSATCGACHTLSAAGTSGTVGPNLDNSFAEARSEKYPENSIENVVLDQIRLGSGEIATYTTNKKFTVQTPMPANLVKGQAAIDVAAYVASVAGAGGYTVQGNLGSDGKSIFKAKCASCHTLADAGSTGTVGPNLDQLKPGLSIVVHQVTVGGGVMPAFKGVLTDAQIQAVAKYVSSVAGKK
jgi:cbb3-type cytochrome c oxidase subunit III